MEVLPNIYRGLRLLLTDATSAGANVDRDLPSLGTLAGRPVTDRAITYEREGGPQELSDNRLDVARMTVSAWGKTDGLAYALALEVRAVMLPEITEGFVGGGPQLGGVYFNGVRLDVGPFPAPGDPLPMYRYITSYLVTYAGNP